MFREISAAAQDRFERSAWAETGEANRACIRLYDERVLEATSNITEQFGDWVNTCATVPLAKLPLQNSRFLDIEGLSYHFHDSFHL